jgi:hypothetical protein
MPRDPWRNAQNRDRPEMSMAQSGFYDTKRGWVDRPTARKRCSDLEPGSYQAFAGATIAPGATGPILIETCDGTIVENAINQTDCTFYMGNRITANVSPCCVIHFTGCGPAESVACCDRMIAVCVNGDTRIIPVDGDRAWAAWAWSPSETCCSACDENRSWYLRVDVGCSGSIVTAVWSLWCVREQYFWEMIGEGTIDWSGVCDDPPVIIDDTLGVTDCDLQIVAAPELATGLCDRCDGTTEPEGCCDKTLWFCINNDSREMAVDGGDETWDVTECCPDCTSATVRLRMTCSNGIISLQRTYTCDGVVSNETTNISQYCSSTATTLLNIPTPNCFLQAQISIAEVACDSCDSCCDETRWYCINNQSKEMTLAGDSDTFDVADCCDCTTATLTLDVECIGQTNTLRYDWSLVCDGGAAITGFDFLACDASVLNIEAGDCFLQIAITTTDVGCAECGGETTTIIPPP